MNPEEPTNAETEIIQTFSMEADGVATAEPAPEPSHLPVIRQLSVALGLLVFVFGITYVGAISQLVKPESAPSDVLVASTIADERLVEKPYTNPFDDTKLNAKAAFVWDVQAQKALFNKNADDILPLASVTKLMTALVAHELLNATDSVDITVDAIKTDGDSGLTDGETFSVQDLIDITLVASSNDGATALGAAAANSITKTNDPDSLFVEAMNIRASQLGLPKTHFNNATGLDVSTSEAGGYSTAREVSFLMEYIITHYPNVTELTKVDVTTIKNEDGAYHSVSNTNEVVNSIEGLIASKTGYTALAGGNLVIAFDAGFNRPIIVTVLGSTHENRFTDVLNLTERARQHVLTEQN